MKVPKCYKLQLSEGNIEKKCIILGTNFQLLRTLLEGIGKSSLGTKYFEDLSRVPTKASVKLCFSHEAGFVKI